MHDDSVRAQLLLVLREVTHANGLGSEEAVSSCHVSRGDSGAGKLQRFAVEDSNDPANGPNEAWAVEARPDHRARPRQIMNGSRQDIGEDLLGGASALDLLRGEVLAPRPGDQKDFVECDALLFREAHPRAG